jgi:hypothetical protein
MDNCMGCVLDPAFDRLASCFEQESEDMAGSPGAPPTQVTITWHDIEEKLPAMAVNAFLLQQTGQEFVLSLGFAAFPYLADPREAANVRTVAAQPIARISMSPGRAVELMNVLQQGIAQWQAQQPH